MHDKAGSATYAPHMCSVQHMGNIGSTTMGVVLLGAGIEQTILCYGSVMNHHDGDDLDAMQKETQSAYAVERVPIFLTANASCYLLLQWHPRHPHCYDS